MPEEDKWSRWLAETRFGADKKAAELQMRGLIQVRSLLLKKAGLADGKVALDVGTGEGLMGFGALEKVGTSGHVIFSDISDACLEKTRVAAEQMGVLDRCSFVRASAEDLQPVESCSVDLVTTRSVLIYVDNKMRALGEFLRVLKPGGRTALFEPIDDRRLKQDAEFWIRRGWVDRESEEGRPIADLMDRWDDYWQRHLHINEAMTNFNERDLVRMCVEVGFAGVHTEYHLNAGPIPPMNWETLKKFSGNPLIPTNEEVWQEIFTAEELRRLEQHLRPVVERGGRMWRSQSSFTWAFKAPIPEKPWAEDE
jgi:SAM-dependent methyltransferase